MSGFLNEDFGGSESEDDDFNPAPAVESDNEDAEDTNATQRRASKSEEPRRNAPENDEDEDDAKAEADDAPVEDKLSRRQSRGGDEEDNEDEAGANDDAGADEDDEERDEEEEEDDEDEEEVTGHRRKRHKRDARLQFIDVEAEVDDEDEEDAEDDEDVPGDQFIADTHPDDLLDLPAGAEKDDQRHRELDRQRELLASMDAEKQAAAFQERYGQRKRAAAADSAIVPQRLLLPSVEDPTIWGVRCKLGKEREIVFAIMKRLEDRANTREPLAISAAFERGGSMAGYVYVEARKQADVMTAVDGLQFAYPRTNMILVPINEMPDLLRTKKSKSLEPGMYVRIKRGKYAGGLAQVEEVETNGLDITVKIVPRLDYGQSEDANAPMIDNGVSGALAKRKRQGALGSNNFASWPPQRLFSEIEAKKKHSKFLSALSSLSSKQWTYLNDTYIDGFLIKDMKVNHLQTEDVNPTLEEVTKFAAGAEDGTENLDLTALAATLKASTAAADFLPGDMVEIYDGEQSGVFGKAISVHSDIVKLRVTEGELKGQTVDAPVKGLRKLFKEGDHVKIIGGSKYFDEVGMVVKVRDDRVTLLTDSNQAEITVFSKDLREATDSGGAMGVSKYDLFDLVQLDASTVACVIKVDRESLRVLTQDGSVRMLLPSNISNKLEHRRFAVATDRDGSEIRIDDTIKEYGGEQKQGRVLHIHRNFLFAQNRQQTENAGVFVVRTSNVTTVAAKGGTAANAGPDLSKTNPALQRNGANGTAMAPPKSFGRDKMIGKTVTVKKGPHKGLLGIVKDTTDDSARVELHTKNKTITVKKDTLAIKDPITGAPADFRGGMGRGGGMPGRTPYSGQTPARVPGWQSARTPNPAMANGGRTPAWSAAAAGARTPAWAAAAQGARTPAWSRQAEGNRTAYGGGATSYGGANSYGGATAYGGGQSTWNPNARTPYNPAAGYSAPTDFGGGRTPAYAAGNRTPAYQGNKTPAYSGSTAWGGGGPETHSGYDAPTPGFGAPTPGDHPTPGVGGRGAYGVYPGQYQTPAAAPTPGGFPETPAPFAAETPAADFDDGPRYE